MEEGALNGRKKIKSGEATKKKGRSDTLMGKHENRGEDQGTGRQTLGDTKEWEISGTQVGGKKRAHKDVRRKEEKANVEKKQEKNPKKSGKREP